MLRKLFSRSPQPAVPVWPNDPKQAIEAVLEQLAAGRNQSAVFSVDEARNYYAQVAAPTPVTIGALVAEIVGNEYLKPEDQVGESQLDRLRQTGWALGDSGNWSREYAEWKDTWARRTVADDIVRALDGFGLPAGYKFARIETLN